MAKIYMGNQEAADRGLLDALRRLADNYHVFVQLQTDSFTWRFDGYERCLESLSTFIPRDPVPLSPAEIERLARHLGVQRQPDAEPVEETDLPTWLRATLSKMSAEIGALRQEVR